jgi:uncharacterized protein (TIGR02145 family)
VKHYLYSGEMKNIVKSFAFCFSETEIVVVIKRIILLIIALGFQLSTSSQSFNNHVFDLDTAIFNPGCKTRSIRAGDIQNNDQIRIVAGTWQGTAQLFIYHYNNGLFQQEWDTTFPGANMILPGPVGDINNDGENEFIVTSPSLNMIYVFKWNGSTYQPISIFSLQSGLNGSMPIIIDDFDGDGVNELVVNHFNSYHRLDLFSFDTINATFILLGSIPSVTTIQLACGNMDNDASKEIYIPANDAYPGKILIAGIENGQLILKDSIMGFSYPQGGCAIGDLDGDGNMELLSGTYNIVAPSYPLYISRYNGTTYETDSIFNATEGTFEVNIGNTNPDSIPEGTLLCNASAMYHVEYLNGAYEVHTINHYGSCVFGDMADVDNDNRDEILAAGIPVNIISDQMCLNVPLSITIDIPSPNILSGNDASFTSTITNGGVSPETKWYVNDTLSCSDIEFSYIPLQNDTVFCIVTSTDTCVTNNPDTSNIIILQLENGIPCPGIPTVDYEGKTYNTVLIGTQCWLKENLDVGSRIDGTLNQTDNGTIEKYCYNDEPDSCVSYGGLYQWDEMMLYTASSATTPSCVQGICPSGWHLPSKAEWDTLIFYLGGEAVAGGDLKETGTIHWQTPNTGATNTSGFTAFAGGIRNNSGGFQGLGPHAYYYTATQDNAPNSWSMRLFYDGATISPNTGSKTMGASVRCILDYCPETTQADAGPDQMNFNSSCTLLEANTPGAEEWGVWTIASGNGGSFENSDDPETSFSGTPGTTYELVWTISNCCGNSSSDTTIVELLTVPGTPCSGMPSVNYEGHVYNTVQIGTQCWLAENLNVGDQIAGTEDPSNNDTIEKFCYDNDPDNCTLYGGLYQWDEMMDYAGSSAAVPSGIQGICPTGWHVPSLAEWDTLIDFLGGDALAGGPMKEMGFCHWANPNTGATNQYGFTARPSGRRIAGGTFDLIESSAFFHSATEDNSVASWSQRIFNYNTTISEHTAAKTEGIPVRCIRDYCGLPDTLEAVITVSENPLCSGDTVCFTVDISNGGSHPTIQWNLNGDLNDGLVAWYPFKGNAIDGSGNGNDGVVYGATPTVDRFGKTNGAYLFDGTDDYIVVPNSPSLNFSEQITISYWVKMETSAPYYFPYHIIEKFGAWGSGQREWDLNFGIGSSMGNWLLSFSPNIYYFLSMTYDGDTLKIYKNGLLEKSLPLGETIPINSNDVYIGEYTYGGNYFFDGTLDDIRIYSRALNEKEVLGLYHEGDTSFCYIPQDQDSVYCIVSVDDSCISNNPDTSNIIVMTVQECLNPCDSITIVDYEGTTYNTVEIGTQCWLKENLNLGTMISGNQEQTDNGILEKYCYASNESNCTSNGALYQWGEMMDYMNCPGSQGICPEGWHIPTDNDIKILEGYSDSNYDIGDPEWDAFGTRGYDAGRNLKDAIDWSDGDDLFGFSGLHTGDRNATLKSFHNLNDEGTFWSSNEESNDIAIARYYTDETDGMLRLLRNKGFGFGVRCIKDTCTSHDTMMVTISASSISVCNGDTVIFIATIENGGSSPTHQWFVNDIPQGATGDTFAYVPLDGDIVCCKIISCKPCLYSNQAYSDSIQLQVNDCSPPCMGIPTVDYAGKTYNTVQIGTQCWLKENLDVGSMINGSTNQSDNGIIEKYCYENNSSNCNIYGGLYQWGEMMDYTNSNGTQGICPDGWHVPSTDDWCTLFTTLDPNSTCNILGTSISNSVGGNLKETGVGLWQSPNTGANNISGFSAIPGGNRDDVGVFYGLGSFSQQWSSTESSSLRGVSTYLWYDRSDVREASFNKPSAYSIRCLKNSCTTIDTLNITISASADTICSGDSVHFTAIPENAGNNPVYQWKINGIDTGSNEAQFGYIPSNHDTITCLVISNDTCLANSEALSNEIHLTLASAPEIQFSLCWPVTSRDAQPITLKGAIPLNGLYSGTGVQNGMFDPSQVPPGQDTVIIRYHYTNDFGCPDADSAILQLHPASNHICGDPYTDIRDNTIYSTIQLGTQCWMAENLYFGNQITTPIHQRDNCVAEYYCFDDGPAPCALGSALYQWDELMDYQETEQVQGLCPPGWHVPGDTEWQVLINLFQDQAHAGTDLKSGGSSGFNALMKGFLAGPQTWKYGSDNTTLSSTLFWTSSVSGNGKSLAHGLNTVITEPDFTTGVSIYSASRTNGFSVRCVKD